MELHCMHSVSHEQYIANLRSIGNRDELPNGVLPNRYKLCLRISAHAALHGSAKLVFAVAIKSCSSGLHDLVASDSSFQV
jgi:hypothetical protein